MLASLPTPAEEVRDYLPVQRATELIADGAPWSAVSPNGRNFKLTLNKDGSGSLRGGLDLSVSWTVKGEALCLNGTLMSKCLRFQQIDGGFQSWLGDKPDLKLSR